MTNAAAAVILLALVVAKTSTFPTAAAFVTPAQRGSNRATYAGGAIASTQVQAHDHPLPPKDETFNPIATVREVLAAPGLPEDVNRFDGVGGLTGGIWRSRVMGIVPATVVAAQLSTKWMATEEAAGNIYHTWPRSVVEILGEKAVTNIGTQVEQHTVVKRAFNKALSPKATLKLKPILESSIQQLVLRWEGFSETGQELKMADELEDFTLNAVTLGLFGEYATPKFVQDTKRCLPAVIKGLFSIPYRFPPPLNRLPMLGFGRSMDARAEFVDVIRDLLRERRSDMAAGLGTSKYAGILDAFLDIQKQQEMGLDGESKGSFPYDDDFIVDNVISTLFAGTDTTAVTLTRVLQLLGTAEDGKEIVDQLVQELDGAVTVDDDELDDIVSVPRAGIFGSFPLLDAIVLESVRLHPTVAGVFRKTRKDMIYNGYLIPEGETIAWSLVQGSAAESLYPEPKKFCPFRFLHGDKKKDAGNAASASPDVNSPDQPIPPIWGFGRHTCPGRELAKLEILLFLKTFLTKFDYEVVKGQSFKGTMPANVPKDKLRVILKAKAAVAE